MKKLTLLIMILSLIVALCACDLEANPDITAQPSEGVASQDTQPTHTVTQPTEPVDPWDANALRAMFPEPPGEIVDYDWSGLTIGLVNISSEDLAAYAQQLLDAGFDDYHVLSGSAAQLTFRARSAEGMVVVIDTGAPFPTVDGTTAIYITDCRLPERMAEQTVWGIDEYQQALPDSGYSYTATGFQEAFLDTGVVYQYYQVKMESAMGYKACKAYAEVLIQAGFVFKQNIYDAPFDDEYSFRGENAEGYMVELKYMEDGVPRICVAKPEEPYPGRQWADFGISRFLPEPDCGNYIFRVTSYATITDELILVGMDYEGAKAYAQALLDRGYSDGVKEEDDPEAKTYRFSASGAIENSAVAGVTVQGSVELIFDPNQTLEDGTPMCMVNITVH